VRLALHKPTEADALDTAADEEAASAGLRLIAGLIVSGRHGWIAEVRGQIAEVKPQPKLPTSAI
jgi:hypothetical protein